MGFIALGLDANWSLRTDYSARPTEMNLCIEVFSQERLELRFFVWVFMAPRAFRQSDSASELRLQLLRSGISDDFVFFACFAFCFFFFNATLAACFCAFNISAGVNMLEVVTAAGSQRDPRGIFVAQLLELSRTSSRDSYCAVEDV